MSRTWFRRACWVLLWMAVALLAREVIALRHAISQVERVLQEGPQPVRYPKR